MPQAGPTSFSSLLSASTTALERGDLSRAAEHAIAATRVAGNNSNSLALAAHALANSGELLLANGAIEALASLSGHRERETLERMASALHAMKCYEPALSFARKARSAGSTDPDWLFFVATLEMFCGDVDAAGTLLEQILRERPDMAAAHWTLAKLAPQTASSNHIDRLHRQIRIRGEGDRGIPYLFFALFKELDDIGETSDAWQALVNGSLSWRRSVDYDMRRDLEGFEQLARAFPRKWSTPTAPPAGTSPQPIFIVGLPRSGTTLVERILGGHSAIRACGELDDMAATMMRSADVAFSEVPDANVSFRIAQSDHGMIAKRYLANTGWRAAGNQRFTDKRPNNFLYIPSIARSMPAAKIVHIHKQPMDACFSLLKEFFGGKYDYSYRLSELTAYHNEYRQLLQHWRDSGHVFLDVSYETLVQDPEGETRRILTYCGLDWQPQCLQTDRRDGAIATASVAQARAPISSAFVASWKRYERQLMPLQDMLAAN